MTGEDYKLLPLAGLGLAKGAWEVYIKPELTHSRLGWAAIGGFVGLYDTFCPEGQTLSEGYDRALESHKVLTIGATAIVAAHLLNVLPEKIDPLHRVAESLRRFK